MATIDYTAKTSTELVTLFMSADAAGKAAITAELNRRDNVVASAGSSIEVFVTMKGGVYCKDKTIEAPSENAKTGAYCPSITFATREQLRGVLAAGTPINKALTAILTMSDDEFAKAMESHSAKKLAQAEKATATAEKAVKATKTAA